MTRYTENKRTAEKYAEICNSISCNIIEILSNTFSDDFASAVTEALESDIIKNVIDETGGFEFTTDDIRHATEQVLISRLGITK